MYGSTPLLCKNCGKKMVFAAITVDNNFISAYLCDCFPQPESMAEDIRKARESNGTLEYDIVIDRNDVARFMPIEGQGVKEK